MEDPLGKELTLPRIAGTRVKLCLLGLRSFRIVLEVHLTKPTGLNLCARFSTIEDTHPGEFHLCFKFQKKMAMPLSVARLLVAVPDLLPVN